MSLKSKLPSKTGIHLATRAMASLFVVAMFAQTSLAQDEGRGRRGDRGDRGDRRGDVMRYLERADRDRDGLLSERELGGRMGEYVRELGINTNKPVAVARIKRAYEQKQKLEANDELMKQIDGERRVAKFGAEIEMTPPPTFAVESLAGAQGRLEDNYDKAMVDTVKAYMRRYDENKDGWLDEGESRRIRRVLGEGADSDENGKLGEMEIAAALKKRSSDYAKDEGGRRDRGGRGRRDRSRDESSARSFTGSNSTPSRTPSRVTTKPASSPPAKSLSTRQTAYIDGLLKRYDKNKNGKLSKEEQGEISGSLKLIDEDGDGEVDRQEALNSLAGTAKARSASASESPKTESRRTSSRRRRRRSVDDDAELPEAAQAAINAPTRGDSSRRRDSNESSGVKYDIRGFQNIPIERKTQGDIKSYLEGKGASSDYFSYDENTDGRISMVEFRDGREWTDELVNDFQQLDSNDDGTVSIEEFNDNIKSIERRKDD